MHNALVVNEPVARNHVCYYRCRRLQKRRSGTAKGTVAGTPIEVMLAALIAKEHGKSMNQPDNFTIRAFYVE
jgi:hypothetical protein